MKAKVAAVIGGGASGLAAAAELLRASSGVKKRPRVVVFEAQERLARKLCASGSGKCNLGNRHIDNSRYNGDKALISSYVTAYDAISDEEFLRDMGIYVTDDGSDRLYPMSFKADSVMTAMRGYCLSLGAEFSLADTITSVDRYGDRFLLNGSFIADAVIFACGGPSAGRLGGSASGYDLLSSLGVPRPDVYPALCALVPDKKYWPASMRGTRAHCEVSLLVNGYRVRIESGEVQFNEKTVSGIPVMDLSGDAAAMLAAGRGVSLEINKSPDIPPDELYAIAYSLLSRGAYTRAEDIFACVMPRSLYHDDLRVCAIKPDETLSPEDDRLKKFCRRVSQCVYPIYGTVGFEDAQAVRGGYGSDAVDPETCALRSLGGVYVCGELLDADGACGGYNLTFARTTGRTAGKSAAGLLLNK